MSQITGWKSWEQYRACEEWTVVLPKGGKLPWAMFYPADYSIASANLGYQYIYRQLKENGIAVERFCSTPIPYRSVDKDTLLERFPIISASISYELGVEEFFKWLNDAHIPLNPVKREEANFPLIIVGGAISYINPMLVSSVADAVILGDGMEVVPQIVEILSEYDIDKDRKKLWNALSKFEDIFVPPIELIDGKIIGNKKICRTQPLDAKYPMYSSWITKNSAFGKTLLLELQRGCIRNCSYCTLPACFGKARRRDIGIFKDEFTKLCAEYEFEQVGLITPEAGDYVQINELLELIESNNKAVSFASLRIDRLNDRMLSALSLAGRHSITVAPETGNDKLRMACGKNFSNELIVERLLAASKHGINKVKLYFMIGLPRETDEDVEAIAELCSNIIDATGQMLIISAGTFVPKPWTKWQEEEFIGISEIKRKYKILTEATHHIKKKTPQLRLTSPKEAEAEFILAWSGSNESLQLAEDIEKYGKRKFNFSDRSRTMRELKQFG